MIRLSPLDPLKVWASSGISWALWFQGRYDEGRAQAMKVMQVFRQVQSLGAYIANSVGAGQRADANSAAQELLKLDPGFCVRHALEVFLSQKTEFREKLASAFRDAGLPE
jgi:hypothetical protein